MRDADKQMLADHYLDLYRMAYLMLKNETDAEDAVQEALVVTMTRQLRGDPYRYCVAVLRNTCINMKKSRELLPDTMIDVPDSVPDGNSLRLHRLLDLIEKLPSRLRDILYLYYEKEHSKAEIAKQMGISETMVKKLFRRGEEMLKDQLIEMEINDKDIFKL